jgi:hypothetical protein
MESLAVDMAQTRTRGPSKRSSQANSRSSATSRLALSVHGPVRSRTNPEPWRLVVEPAMMRNRSAMARPVAVGGRDGVCACRQARGCERRHAVGQGRAGQRSALVAERDCPATGRCPARSQSLTVAVNVTDWPWRSPRSRRSVP